MPSARSDPDFLNASDVAPCVPSGAVACGIRVAISLPKSALIFERAASGVDLASLAISAAVFASACCCFWPDARICDASSLSCFLAVLRSLMYAAPPAAADVAAEIANGTQNASVPMSPPRVRSLRLLLRLVRRDAEHRRVQRGVAVFLALPCRLGILRTLVRAVEVAEHVAQAAGGRVGQGSLHVRTQRARGRRLRGRRVQPAHRHRDQLLARLLVGRAQARCGRLPAARGFEDALEVILAQHLALIDLRAAAGKAGSGERKLQLPTLGLILPIHIVGIELRGVRAELVVLRLPRRIVVDFVDRARGLSDFALTFLLLCGRFFLCAVAATTAHHAPPGCKRSNIATASPWIPKPFHTPHGSILSDFTYQRIASTREASALVCNRRAPPSNSDSASQRQPFVI